MEYVIGIAVGFVLALLLFAQPNVVTIHGTKDAVQTVEWHDKNYRLEPLDKAKKP